MNRHIIIYILVALILVGCSEKYDEGLGLYPTLTPRYMTITPTSLTYASSPSTKAINITSTQTPWKIENGIDWVSASPTSGSTSATVSVGVTENKSGDDARTGIFYLKADVNDWRYEAPISVTQAGAAPFIKLSKTELDFTGSSANEEVIVSANCSWIAESSSEWLTINKNNNKIYLSVSSNETSTHRTATISVIHTGTINISSIITVRQAPASITASTETLVFNNTAGTVDVTINSEAPWTAASSSSWINISPTTGDAGTSTLKVSVSPNTSINERTGYVILSIGSRQQIQIPVRQRGIYIDVDKTALDFIALGESTTLTVSSNTSWSVINCPSWLTVSQLNGNGNATLTITASNNASTSQRFATINVTQEGVAIGASIDITQNGKYLDVSSQSLSFDDIASTKSFEIRADELWTIQNDNSWFSVSPSSGSNITTVDISVSENETEVSREGYLYVTMLDKTMSIKVSQNAKVFSAETDKTDITFSSSGEKKSVHITSNTSWTITNCPQWISLSKSEGKGNARVEITAQENPNTTERSATLYLQIDGKTDKSAIIIQQHGKSFSLTPSSLSFSDKSDSQTVTIETDGSWNATTSSPWISLSPHSASGESSLTITVSENTTDAERNGSVQVSVGDKTLSIMVNQKGKFLTIANSLLTYTSKGGTISITVTTNDTWTAYTEDNVSWLSISQSNGVGTADIKVEASDNASVNPRIGYIVVETPHGQSVRVMVNQKARYLTTDHNSILFYSKGGTSEAITVSTDGAYGIACSDTWFTVSQSSNTFTVTASENLTTNTRIGSITISLTDLTEGTFSLNLTVTQLNYGGSFLREGYGDDKDYDTTDNSSSNMILRITPFMADADWDSGHKGEDNYSGLSISVSNFKTDQRWDSDSNYSSKVNVIITGHSEDKDYDDHTKEQSSGTISKTIYESDKNWQ